MLKRALLRLGRIFRSNKLPRWRASKSEEMRVDPVPPTESIEHSSKYSLIGMRVDRLSPTAKTRNDSGP